MTDTTTPILLLPRFDVAKRANQHAAGEYVDLEQVLMWSDLEESGPYVRRYESADMM